MQVTLNMDSEARRPIVQNGRLHGCRAMLGTGALFPNMGCHGGLLESLGAKLIKKDVEFIGFGGNASGSLYRVNFVLNGLIYVDMPFALGLCLAIWT